jgi:hypothetical protein
VIGAGNGLTLNSSSFASLPASVNGSAIVLLGLQRDLHGGRIHGTHLLPRERSLDALTFSQKRRLLNGLKGIIETAGVNPFHSIFD